MECFIYLWNMFQYQSAPSKKNSWKFIGRTFCRSHLNGPGRIRLYQWSNSASCWYLFVFVAIKPRPHLTLIGLAILQPVEKDSDGRIVFKMDLWHFGHKISIIQLLSRFILRTIFYERLHAKKNIIERKASRGSIRYAPHSITSFQWF